MHKDKMMKVSQAISVLLFMIFSHVPAYALGSPTQLSLSKEESLDIGKKVWQNECKGTIDGLTWWNLGEEFPSLGIGHFIWFPAGLKVPFEERFPKVLSFLQSQGVKLPEWLTPETPCPWESRDQFLADLNGKRMTELRNLLAETVDLQAQFMVKRLESVLPKILEKASPAQRETIAQRFNRVLSAGSPGVFCLVDYVNFKNEGIVDTERYNGQGWGMLQVLEGMKDTDNPVKDFAESAIRVLEQRVRNSPKARNEIRWLPGWTKRLNKYWQSNAESAKQMTEAAK